MRRVRSITKVAAAAGITLAGVTMYSTAAYAAATATASPNTGLTDGAVINVDGTGYPPNTTIQMIECTGSAATPPADQTHCDGLTFDSQSFSDSTGAVHNGTNDTTGLTTGFTVHKILNTSTGRTDCSAAPCTIYVGTDKSNFPGSTHAFADIAFAPTALVPESPITPLLPLSGAVVLLGGGYLVYRRRSTPTISAT